MEQTDRHLLVGQPPEVWIVLDVDGVLNRLPGQQDTPSLLVTRRDGKNFPIRVDLAVMAALNELVQPPGVRLGWLTTWGSDVDHLFADAFDGMLASGQVVTERPDEIFVPMDWKLRALLIHLEHRAHPRYVYADDDAVNAALLFNPESTGDSAKERLLFDPDPTIGLTVANVRQVQEFMDRADHRL